MIPSLEQWPTKAKEASSPHEVGLTPLNTNLVSQCPVGINLLRVSFNLGNILRGTLLGG